MLDCLTGILSKERDSQQRETENLTQEHSSFVARPGGGSELRSARRLPGLRVLPAGVCGVIKVKQEAFATIQKAQAKDKIPEEGEGGY